MFEMRGSIESATGTMTFHHSNLTESDVEALRQAARASAPAGSVVTITVTEQR